MARSESAAAFYLTSITLSLRHQRSRSTTPGSATSAGLPPARATTRQLRPRRRCSANDAVPGRPPNDLQAHGCGRRLARATSGGRTQVVALRVGGRVPSVTPSQPMSAGVRGAQRAPSGQHRATTDDGGRHPAVVRGTQPTFPAARSTAVTNAAPGRVGPWMLRGSIPPVRAALDTPAVAAQHAQPEPHQRTDERGDEDQQPDGPRELPHQELDRHIVGVLDHEDGKRPDTRERGDGSGPEPGPLLCPRAWAVITGLLHDARPPYVVYPLLDVLSTPLTTPLARRRRITYPG